MLAEGWRPDRPAIRSRNARSSRTGMPRSAVSSRRASSARARRSTARLRNGSVAQAHTLCGQLVEVGGAGVGVAVGSDFEAVVFGNDQKDVRPTRGQARQKRSGEKRCREEKKSGSTHALSEEQPGS